MNTHGRLTVPGVNWLFLVSLFGQILVGVLLETVSLVLHKETDFNLLMLAVQLFAVFIPTIVYMAYKGVDMGETLRLKPLAPLAWVLIPVVAIAGQFIAQILNLPILLLLDAIGTIPESPIPAPKNITELAVSFAVIALAPAICEEIMTRGVLLRTYERRGSYAGLMLSALFFGIMHMDIKNLLGPIVFGLLFGYMVYRTGSILAGMLAHFTNNAFAMLLSYLGENYGAQLPFLQDGTYVIVGFIVSVFILVIVYRATRNTFSWQVKPRISSFKNDLKAAFFNIPMMITLVMYVFFTIITLLQVIYPGKFGV